MTTPDKAYRWWFRDPVTKILFKGTFGKIGVKNLVWHNYDSVTEKTPEEREHMIAKTETLFAQLNHKEAKGGASRKSISAKAV